MIFQSFLSIRLFVFLLFLLIISFFNSFYISLLPFIFFILFLNLNWPQFSVNMSFLEVCTVSLRFSTIFLFSLLYFLNSFSSLSLPFFFLSSLFLFYFILFSCLFVFPFLSKRFCLFFFHSSTRLSFSSFFPNTNSFSLFFLFLLRLLAKAELTITNDAPVRAVKHCQCW